MTNYADVESVWIDGMIEIVEKLKYNYVVWEEVFRQVLSESCLLVPTYKLILTNEAAYSKLLIDHCLETHQR